MKTKLLSVFLVLAMLLTSVLCLLPAAAETDYDAEAKTKGYVCRVGTAEEAAKDDYAGYYKNVLDASYAARTGGKTITMIADATLSGNNMTTDSQHAFVLEGNNQTLTISGVSFRSNGGTMTVKNLKVVTADDSSEGVITSNGGVMTFENCSFTTTAKYKRAHGFISSNTSAEASLTFKNCNFSIDATSTWAKGGTAFFHRYGSNNPVLNFEGTTLDLSNTVLPLSNSGNVILSVKDGSTIKTTKSIPSANVTIADSTVECTADGVNLFDYQSYGTVNITATNAKLIGKKYTFKIAGCKSAVNVTLDGNTVVNGTKRAFSVTNNDCPVTITAKGNTTIQSSGEVLSNGEEKDQPRAIHVVGSNSENATFALTMTDHAKLISPKDGVTFNEESYAIKKATITVLDAVTIDTPNGTFLPTATIIAAGSIAYIRSDRATMNVREQYTDAGKFVVNDVYSPVMEKGASIRTVEGSKGIRFTSTMKKVADTEAVKLTATYGTLIVKAADLEGKEFTIDALTKAGVKFANIVATAAGTVAGETETTYNAALVNLPDDQLDTNFAARAYAVYTINGVEHYVYSDFNATDNCRSMSQIASKAQADTQSTKSADYPYEIAAGVYSPYTKSQYAVISEYVKKN